MNQTFQYRYRAKPWMDELLAIREKYLPGESGTSVKKREKDFHFNNSQTLREKDLNIRLL